MTKLEKLGATLQKSREVRNLTVREAAEKAGIGEGELVFTEGGRGASPATLGGLARVYSLDVIELMILAGHLSKKDVKRHQERQAA